MWSIAWIVGVAVASSMLLLVVGVTMAVTIERHRHHKILQRHGIQIDDGLRRRFQIALTTANSPTSVRSDRRLPSQEAGWSVNDSTEYLYPDIAQTVCDISQIPPVPARALFRPPYHQQRMRTPKRAKLRKRIPLVVPTSSPLSAITELTDSPCSPLVFEKGGNPKEQEGRQYRGIVAPIPWRNPMRKTNWDQNQIVERTRYVKPNTIACKEQPLSFPSIPQATSMTDTASTPPNEPLPPLPITPRKNITVQGSRGSPGSIETINSSVLESRSSHIAERKPQDLEEFDFGLGVPTLQVESPARTLRQSCWDDRNAIISLRASFNLGSTEKSEGASWSHLNNSRGGNKLLDLRSRHSMLEVDTLRNLSSNPAHLPDKVEDPFTTPSLLRPASLGCQPISSSLHKRVSTQSSGMWLTSPSKKGHKRQNCVRISGIPVLQPKQSQIFQMPQVIEEQDPNSANSATTSITSPAKNEVIDGQSPWPQPLTIKRSNTVNNPVKNNLVSYVADTCSDYSGLSQYWSIECTPSRNPPSPTRFDSPILPSPAYHSSRLFPRKSKVQGPRSPPSRLPLPRNRLFTSNQRKPAMVLKALNSESTYSLTTRIGKNLFENTQTGVQSVHRSMPEAQSNFGSPSSISSSYTLHQKEGGISRSATSVWEDASVHGDSPEPELPTPTRINLVNNTQSSHLLPTTPQSVVEHGVMKNLKQKSDLTFDASNLENMEIVGLGLTIGTMNKPPSLYDREGFLK